MDKLDIKVLFHAPMQKLDKLILGHYTKGKEIRNVTEHQMKKVDKEGLKRVLEIRDKLEELFKSIV